MLSVRHFAVPIKRWKEKFHSTLYLEKIDFSILLNLMQFEKKQKVTAMHLSTNLLIEQ